MKEIRKRRRLFRIIVVGLAFALVTITFTPVILNPGKIEPRLFHMPYTLWTSILITMLLVFLTYLVSKLQDKD